MEPWTILRSTGIQDLPGHEVRCRLRLLTDLRGDSLVERLHADRCGSEGDEVLRPGPMVLTPSPTPLTHTAPAGVRQRIRNTNDGGSFRRTLRMRQVATVISPESVPARQYPPDVVERGMTTAEGHDPLDLVRRPEVVEDFINGGWVQVRLVAGRGVVADTVSVLVPVDDGEDVLECRRRPHGRGRADEAVQRGRWQAHGQVVGTRR